MHHVRTHTPTATRLHTFFLLHTKGNGSNSTTIRWITIPPPTETAGTINSMQNGLLLRADIHRLFGNYIISVNPDVRIVHEVYGIPLTNCFGIITRFSALNRTIRASPVTIWISNCFRIRLDPLINYFAGIFAIRFSLI